MSGIQNRFSDVVVVRWCFQEGPEFLFIDICRKPPPGNPFILTSSGVVQRLIAQLLPT
jgi:hypothetical protein